MTNKTVLEILMLLSAMESWTLSLGKPLPEHLHEQMKNLVKLLSERIVVESNPGGRQECDYLTVLTPAGACPGGGV